MAEIVGTITTVKDFLSKSPVIMSVKPGTTTPKTFCLEENRVYSIPAFQREIRWDENNLNMLMYDLSRGSKFLGNIILTIKSDHTCEIIDGQQRTTVLMLIVRCIKEKYGTKISVPEFCPLQNESFSGFQILLDNAFDKERLTKDQWRSIQESDHYHQLHRLQSLWRTIESSEILSDRHKAQSLLDNLCNSEFNVIASHSDNVNTGIQYFLDVNLKGVRLDTEDIFKGYLFSQDDRKETRDLWQKNKHDVLRLNSARQSSEEKRYPLMKLYAHFFYCDLYLPKDGICEYTSIKFGENFCLTSGFISGDTKFYEGNHLIEAIRDREYLKDVLYRLNKCVEIMIDIVENEGPSNKFKSLFICDKTIDSLDISNCHAMLKKVLLDKEIVPKILVLKYILTCFDGEEHKKEEYKSFYTIYCAAVLFTVFATKKEGETFYNIVKSTDYINKLNKEIYDYISSHRLTKGRVCAVYKYSEGDDNDKTQQYRCKSLAAISNFFRIEKKGDRYNLTITNTKELYEFFNTSSKYSLEHLIIGDKGSLEIVFNNNTFPYPYPPEVKKYANSLFNYIFIPENLNSSLGNKTLHSKLGALKEYEDKIDCEYSKTYCSLLHQSPSLYFTKYPTKEQIDSCESEDEVRLILDQYFKKFFSDDFLEFATALSKEIKLSTQ